MISTILTALLLSLPSPASAGDQDRDPWETIQKEIGRGRYEDALGAFTDVRLHCEGLVREKVPECLAKAEFNLANLFFELEKKKAAQDQAERLFQEFLLFHPAHPWSVEARFKLAVITFRRIISHDKDVERAKRAEDALVAFLFAYPDSPFSDQARAYLAHARETMARHHLEVARFYLRRRAMPAAASRARELLQNYSEFPDLARKAQEVLDKTEK